MATNIYKFFGKTSTAAETATLLSPSLNETFVIKSIRVTNKSSVNTPTVTIKNNTFEIINTQTLVISTSITYTTAGTVTDGVVFSISFLNIKKDLVD
jgi:hypothetical protein